MTHPTLYDVVRYSANVEVETENGRRKFQPLIGEESGLLTVFSAFAMARRPTIVDAFSGTGKTVMADAVVSLLPAVDVETVDMLSAKAIYAKAADINKKRFMYAPELQNAGDQDEFVKALKKLGEGKSAKREVTGGILDDIGTRAVLKTELNWIPTLTTRAVENKKADEIFNEEAQRRFVIVATDASGEQTGRVVKAQARQFARGVKNVRTMTPLEDMQLRSHVAECVNAYERISEVLIPGLEAFAACVPTVFTSTRSAFPTLVKVAGGVSLFYHKSEHIVHGKDAKGNPTQTLVMSPERFAETIEFYGPTFFANCMRLPAMGRALLEAMPALQRTDYGTVKPESMLSLDQIVDRLALKGWSIERKKVESVVKSLKESGFLVLNEELEGKLYHVTALSDIKSNVDWPAFLEDARSVAKETLGSEATEWVKRYAAGSTVTYTSPITGKRVSTGAK